MQLRDACVVSGAILVLCAATGCNNSRNSRTIYDNKSSVPHFKTDSNTPHAAAQNEVALAQEYIQQGQYQIALDRLQHAAKLDPSSPDAYTVLGLLYEKINRLDLAEVSYAKSLKLAPNNGAMLNNYGTWLCRSGHPAEAEPYFRRAIADPFYKTPTVAAGNAAICAAKAGKPEIAGSYYRQMLTLDANNAEALEALAGISYQTGDYLRARGFMERLVATGKTSPEMLDLAARIEDKLGDPESARSYRSRLATEFPQFTPGQH